METHGRTPEDDGGGGLVSRVVASFTEDSRIVVAPPGPMLDPMIHSVAWVRWESSIHAALRAAHLIGQPVYFQPGVYILSRPL